MNLVETKDIELFIVEGILLRWMWMWRAEKVVVLVTRDQDYG